MGVAFPLRRETRETVRDVFKETKDPVMNVRVNLLAIFSLVRALFVARANGIHVYG